VLFAARDFLGICFGMPLAASAIGFPARMRQAARDNTSLQSKCRSLDRWSYAEEAPRFGVSG
jgi:hypothetical protein